MLEESGHTKFHCIIFINTHLDCYDTSLLTGLPASVSFPLSTADPGCCLQQPPQTQVLKLGAKMIQYGAASPRLAPQEWPQLGCILAHSSEMISPEIPVEHFSKSQCKLLFIYYTSKILILQKSNTKKRKVPLTPLPKDFHCWHFAM